jgi:hypothetical protein
MRSNNVEMKMEGKEVIAFGVYSPRAKDTLWCAKDATILPNEPIRVFYFDELPTRADKKPDALRRIYLVKNAFHGARVPFR